MDKISLAGRVVIALILMVGFYVLALAVAGGLLYIPYAEYTYGGRLHVKLALVCVAGASLILWSVLPRMDRFTPPGPTATREAQPKLFELIDEVSTLTGQALPTDVYLVMDMNAWVAQRGGVMGFGSHRVMGLGLPLMQLLSVDELKAVLAHEFGHFHGGDTRLGPFIYKTRGAIGRTIESLVEADAPIIHRPFEWYAAVFMRITQGISRRQELQADALAARTVSADALITGLKKVESGAAAYDSYWSNDVAPLLKAGRLPSLAQGFSRYLGAREVQEVLVDVSQQSMAEGKSDPYDSHPALPERVAALAELGGDPNAESSLDGGAAELLGDIVAVERQVLNFRFGDAVVADFEPIEWTDAVLEVYVPSWRRAAAGLPEDVLSWTPLQVSRDEDTYLRIAKHIATDDVYRPRHERVARGRNGVAAAVAALAVGAGGRVEDRPLDGLRIIHRELDFSPWEDIVELSDDDWRARMQALGIDGVTIRSIVA